ncbi:exonuclease domain-containing protein [Bifidobacterium sp.]|jgi:DNA polymerase-3 subunit epsilon|uniref:exonuclease domain-containing protein n=1 Tax=Bifidobacterium sp. TaxID=41200 RepID=UPI0025C47D95|nr:exonuclease domain-containing protein [Bifidobacterium sp.]MCH4208753.1 DNA polymerase III subunit epsilon [Bifidobacterium sp.]MCI1224013.1 DNA polymerase III subunit epsilon [Bifidobacterium sp.]
MTSLTTATTASHDALAAALSAAPEQGEDTLLPDSLLLGFDTETTGTYAGRDAIVSATLVLRDPKAGYAGDTVGEWIISPHRPMNPHASAVNGFTDEFLSEHGEEPQAAIARIVQLIETAQSKRIPLLAYNAPFDVRMLAGDLRRWKLGTLPDDLLVADPLVIDRAISKRSGKRNLSYTAEYYGVEPHGDFHDATADTTVAVDLIAPISALYPQVGHLTLAELMGWQRKAFVAWRDNFNTWLQRKGRQPIHDTWL